MGSGQEKNAFEVNMVVAEELARQLRLRDLGGIIVVDLLTWIHPITGKNFIKKCRS
jgi:Ribonuclease G/E